MNGKRGPGDCVSVGGGGGGHKRNGGDTLVPPKARRHAMELAKELAEDKLSAKGLAKVLRPSRLFPAGLTLPSPMEVTESVMAVNPNNTLGVPGDCLPPTDSCALLSNCISANICCTVCTGWDGWGARAKTWVIDPDPGWGESMRATLPLFA